MYTHNDIIKLYEFPEANLGARQTPWNLSSLLYYGASQERHNLVISKIIHNEYGEPKLKRKPLVDLIYAYLRHQVVLGTSLLTIASKISVIRTLFNWCETHRCEPTVENIEQTVIEWSKYLVERVRLKKIKHVTANGYLSAVCPVIDSIFDYKGGLKKRTTVRRSKKSRTTNTDKQNLDSLFKFGNFLYDITLGLTSDAIRGNLPLQINLRDGNQLIEWSKLLPEARVKSLSQSNDRPTRMRDTLRRREPYITTYSITNRHPLLNLRIEAELLIFIAETGMNLATAYALPYSKFSFKSISGGYELRRIYKNRAKGEIVGIVHKEYREVFDCYLRWLDDMFTNPERGLLFPFHNMRGKSSHIAPAFIAIKKRCLKLGFEMVGARKLRKAKINFLLRETHNPEATAEYAQHSIKTLFNYYIQPNHQIALIEITKFHELHDPTLEAVGPGICASMHPIAEEKLNVNAPPIDCLSPSGCLFCTQNRDIEGYDHIWSLLSFQHLKSIELAKLTDVKLENNEHPAYQTVQRIQEKIELINKSSAPAGNWIDLARNKIAEGDYHPKWDGFIQLHRHSI
jgi:hypothetical protein